MKEIVKFEKNSAPLINFRNWSSSRFLLLKVYESSEVWRSVQQIVTPSLSISIMLMIFACSLMSSWEMEMNRAVLEINLQKPKLSVRRVITLFESTLKGGALKTSIILYIQGTCFFFDNGTQLNIVRYINSAKSALAALSKFCKCNSQKHKVKAIPSHRSPLSPSLPQSREFRRSNWHHVDHKSRKSHNSITDYVMQQNPLSRGYLKLYC